MWAVWPMKLQRRCCRAPSSHLETYRTYRYVYDVWCVVRDGMAINREACHEVGMANA